MNALKEELGVSPYSVTCAHSQVSTDRERGLICVMLAHTCNVS